MKKFNTSSNIGNARYVVNHHDGVKQHDDGSSFFDIAVFSNKVKFNAFIRSLTKSGYEEKSPRGSLNIKVNNEAPVTNPARSLYLYQAEYELGIASNTVRVKNAKGRAIGTIEAKDIPRFMNMSKGETPATFKPVKDWKLCFSVVLMDELGISI